MPINKTSLSSDTPEAELGTPPAPFGEEGIEVGLEKTPDDNGTGLVELSR